MGTKRLNWKNLENSSDTVGIDIFSNCKDVVDISIAPIPRQCNFLRVMHEYVILAE